MTARITRAGGALIVLLALVVGVPLLLAGTIGNPADAWPDLKVGDVTDQVVIDVLAAIVWVAWAQFTVSVLAEVIAAARRAPARRLVLVPAPSQQIARILVTSVLIAGAASGALATHRTSLPPGGGTAAWRPVAAATALTAPNAGPAPAAVAGLPNTNGMAPMTGRRTASGTTVTDTPPDPARTYLVPAGGTGPDTLWDIAAAYCGGGQHWQAIWVLNRGRTQPDGTVMTQPGLLRPGWTVLLPATATSPATRETSDDEPVPVRPGDTLSGLAAAHGQHDWHQAWAASAGMPEPGGRRFTDPNLILPGWTVEIPVPAATSPPAKPPMREGTGHAPPTGPSETVPCAGTATTAARSSLHSAPASVSNKNRGEASATPQAPPAAAAPAPAETPTAAAGTASSPASTPAETGRRTPAPNGLSDGTRPAAREPLSHGSSGLQTVGFGAGGALLAGAALGALAVHRRRQFRWRRPGRAIAEPTPDLWQTERDLLAAGPAGAADVEWLDTALRSLARATAVSGRPLPDVVAVRISDDVLELILTTPDPDPPAPWRIRPDAGEPGSRWTLRRGDTPALSDADRQRQLAPFPTLAAIGHTSAGESWLLDLERVGALSLTGDRDRCLDLARFVAAELAYNPWSAMLNVTLAGFGAEMAEANPDRLTHTTDSAAAVAALHRQVDSVAAARRDLDVDVLGGRQRNIAGDAWAPHVLLLAPVPAAGLTGPAQAATGELLAAMRAQPGRTAAGLLIVGDTTHTDQTRWQLTLNLDGSLTLPALGLQLIAQQLPAGEAADLARLLAQAADTTDRPMPPAPGTQPWDAHADAAGNLHPDPTGSGEQVVLHLVDPDDPPPWRAAGPRPLPTHNYLERTLAGAGDAGALAPPVSAARRRQVLDADPQLDRDLADWHDPDSPRPKVSVLGPVQVRAQGPLPDRSPRRAWNTEVVVYLVTHPRGASSEQLGSDLWPDDDDADIGSKSKIRQAAVDVRRWLGTDPATGQDYLPKTPTGGLQHSPGRYQLTGALLDAELFRRLRIRGQARGPDGIEDLWAALRLVTGTPYDELRRGGYRWLADNHDEHTCAAMIYDTAHALAEHHIGAGEPLRAIEAAQVALLAGSSEDTALLDIMVACDAKGDWSQGDCYQRRVLANHDADIPEDCPPSTAQALIRRERLRRTAT